MSARRTYLDQFLTATTLPADTALVKLKRGNPVAMVMVTQVDKMDYKTVSGSISEARGWK